MGNTHAFEHRLPAIFAGSFASIALGLLSVSGAHCRFLKIQAKDGYALSLSDGTVPPGEASTYLGVICVNPLYDDILEDDAVFTLSRVCLFVALAMGSFTCVLSWALSSFVTPTEANWKLLSVVAAVSTLLQMPVFLLFETDPCTHFVDVQECVLSSGGYYLILSSVCWVIVALVTQFMDPPRWADELNAWKTSATNHQRTDVTPHHVVSIQDEHGTDGDSQAPLLKPPSKISFLSRVQNTWTHNKSREGELADLPFNHTDSLSVDEDPITKLRSSNLLEPTTDITELSLVVIPIDRRTPPMTDDADADALSHAEDGEFPVQVTEERSVSVFKPLPPPSLDAISVDSCQQEQQDLQMVVWDASFAEDQTETHIVQGIYSDLENPPELVGETKMILADSCAMMNQNISIFDEPCSTPTKEERTEPTSIAETQIASTEPSESVHQYSSASNGEKDTTILLEHTSQPTEQRRKPGKLKMSSSRFLKKLSETVKKGPKVVGRSGKNQRYALISDDESVASLSLFPTEVIIYDNAEIPGMPGTPSKQSDFPSFDPSFSNTAQAWEDPPITYMESFDDCTTEEEDEPNPIISPDVSMDTGGPSDEGDDDESSDPSDCDVPPYEGVIPKNDSQRNAKSYSSLRSIVSSTSLLETMIEEETDDDLREFYSSPYGLVRSQSAPVPNQYVSENIQQRPSQHISMDGQNSVSTMDSAAFMPSTSYSEEVEHSCLDDVQLAPVMSFHANMESNKHNYEEASWAQHVSVYDSLVANIENNQRNYEEASWAQHVSVYDSLAITDLEDLENLLATDHSQIAGNDEERSGASSPGDEARAQTASEIESPEYTALPITKPPDVPVPISPTSTAPETPSPGRAIQEGNPNQQDLSTSFESTDLSWKEDRELRGGIHAVPIPDSPCNISDRVTRARESRIRRLQQENASTSLASSKVEVEDDCHGVSTMASVVDKLDLELIEVLRPDGCEYGPDERSL
ncbi:expressed unknown protein [Seminavis robusta]|uniref:Uncharacterized protein n=1 Tax=Seminavis robusta TaxID=568900 RepID=A0A9N8E4P7_9STRA|nr:expressed unknown protein [Seminavis robusta]|eukprot:Sro648_g181110.1 n/a (979) ;mRNA; f:47108-50044